MYQKQRLERATETLTQVRSGIDALRQAMAQQEHNLMVLARIETVPGSLGMTEVLRLGTLEQAATVDELDTALALVEAELETIGREAAA